MNDITDSEMCVRWEDEAWSMYDIRAPHHDVTVVFYYQKIYSVICMVPKHWNLQIVMIYVLDQLQSIILVMYPLCSIYIRLCNHASSPQPIRHIAFLTWYRTWRAIAENNSWRIRLGMPICATAQSKYLKNLWVITFLCLSNSCVSFIPMDTIFRDPYMAGVGPLGHASGNENISFYPLFMIHNDVIGHLIRHFSMDNHYKLS